MKALSALVLPAALVLAATAFAYNGQDPIEQGPMTPDQQYPYPQQGDQFGRPGMPTPGMPHVPGRPAPGYREPGRDGHPGHVRTLAGRWVLTDRMCSSGAVPQDGFRMGRDHYEFQLTRHGYRSYLRTGRCEQWTEGVYRVDRNALHFYVHNFNSTCPAQSPREFHYSYRMHENGAMSVLMGPSRGPGSCRYGEFLESVFERDGGNGGGGHRPPRQEPPEDQDDPGQDEPLPPQPPEKPLF